MHTVMEGGGEREGLYYYKHYLIKDYTQDRVTSHKVFSTIKLRLRPKLSLWRSNRMTEPPQSGHRTCISGNNTRQSYNFRISNK